jgi:hypothetical protein
MAAMGRNGEISEANYHRSKASDVEDVLRSLSRAAQEEQ